MKKDWLNKNLEEKLNGYDSPMDLESAWESLQAKRKPPQKKNKFFFFWIIFGWFAIGAGGSYFFLNNLSNNNYNNTITEVNNISKNENQSFEKTELSTPTLSNSKNITHEKVDDNIFTKNKTIQNNTKKLNYENQNFSNSKEIKLSVDANPSFSTTKNNNVITPNINLDFSEKPNENFIFQKQNEEENTTVIDSIIPQKEVQPIAVLFLPRLEMSFLKLYQKENYEIIDASFSRFYFSQLTEPRVAYAEFKLENYLIISTGYGIRSKGKILAQEKSIDVFSINALFEKRFMNRKTYFKTGINFDQFVNSTEFITEQPLVQSLDNQLIAINHFQNGTTEEVFGTANVQDIKQTKEKNFNRYRLISIPLILGYDLLSFYKSTFQIEGGIARSVFGFHSGKSFDLIDSDFEKRGVWQGIYGVNFNLKMGKNTQLFSSIKGNYHFNKIGKSDQLEMEKFRLHQIQLGLRFKL